MKLKTIINTKYNLLAKSLLLSLFIHGGLWTFAPEKFASLELNKTFQSHLVKVKDQFIEVKLKPKAEPNSAAEKVAVVQAKPKKKQRPKIRRSARKAKRKARRAKKKIRITKRKASVKPIAHLPAEEAPTKELPLPQKVNTEAAQHSHAKVATKAVMTHSMSERSSASGETQVARRVSKRELRGILRGYYSSLNSLMREKRLYPRSARRLKLEGTVLVEMVVNKRGEIVSVKLAQSSGHDLLDQAAIAQVQKIGKVPSMPKQLKRPSMTFRIPFEYRLQS